MASNTGSDGVAIECRVLEDKQMNDLGGDQSRPKTHRRERVITCYNCGNVGHKKPDCPIAGTDRHKNWSTGRRRYDHNYSGGQYGGSWDQNRHQHQWGRNYGQRGDRYPKSDRSKTIIDLFPELPTHYLNEALSDITFVIDGQSLVAHQFVLSAKSDVFKDLIASESDPKRIVLNDINVKAFRVLLKFFYYETDLSIGEECGKDFVLALKVITLCNRFQVTRLSAMVEEYLLKKFINPNNVSDIENGLKFGDEDVNELMAVLDKVFALIWSPRFVVIILKAMAQNNPKIDLKRFNHLFDAKKCSPKEIELLTDMGVYGGKDSSDPQTYDQKNNDLKNEEPKVNSSEESEIKTTEEPEIKTSEEPEIKTIEEPDVKTTEEPEIKTIEEPDVKTTEEPEIKTIEEPDVKTTEEPEIKTIEEPEIKTTEEPEAKTTEEPDVKTTEETEAKTTEESEAKTTEESEAKTTEESEAKTTEESEAKTTE